MSPWLKLDIDRQQRLPSRGRMRRLLRRAGYDIQMMTCDRSSSGRGWHVQVLVTPAPTTCCEVVALQAMLGSDPGRESVNLLRARRVDAGQVSPWWAQRWNVLYTGGTSR